MAFRYPAGLITAGSPVTPEYPSGVWTNQQAAPYINGQVWANDPFFNQTVLLLHGDGTNGAQNNTFLDSSSNNFTITRNGNTTQGTFSPFSVPEGYWGNYFDGTGDRLGISNNAAFRFGANPFTIEFFVYLNSTSGSPNFIVCYDNSSTGYTIALNASAKLTVNLSGDVADITGSTTILTNTWYHVAVSGTGGTSVKLFLNGVQEGSTYTGATSLSPSNYELAIGAFFGGGFGTSNVVNGYMSNVRFLNGTALYTSAFTPPSAPLTAIANTSLLTCQSNRFVDNSANNFAITRTGDVRVTPFDPFLPTSAYSPSVTGGSGYFDGNGDALTVASNLAFALDRTFVLETWVYPFSYNPNNGVSLFDFRTTNEMGYLTIKGTGTAGQIVFAVGPSTGTTLSTSQSIPLNAWTHIVAVSDSSGSSIFLNGVRDANTATQATYPTTARPCIIGQDFGLANFSPLNGYLAGTRVVKGGTLPYSSASTTITVPTAPPTSTANTSLLANFTNAGILDNTMFNNLETAGNVQVSTTLKKYGTGAIYFDGSGDFTVMPINKDIDFTSSGSITVEFWMYGESTTRAFLIGSNAFNSSTSNYSAGILVDWTPGVTCYISAGRSGGLNLGAGVVPNTWYHVAFVYNGATTTNYAFLNGLLMASSVSSSAMTQTGAMLLGVQGSDRILPYKGYIDDLRITKVARYTANFTPPIARFPNQ